MVIKTTRWLPDTCQCIVEYTWDNNIQLEERVHTLSRLIKSCESHEMLVTELDVYNSIKEENQRKNKTLSICLQNGPNSLYDIRGDGERILKETIQYKWSWSGDVPNRNLNVSFISNIDGSKITLTGKTKTDIDSSLSTEFGIGKVSIL